MAEGRMLRKKITTDEKIRELSLKAAFLFTWMIPFQDREGRFLAEPSIIKGQIVPYIEEFTLRNIPIYLKEIENAGLIRIYGKHREYMDFPKFSNNNTIHKNEAKSHIPSYEMSVHCPDIGKTLSSINELKGIKMKGIEINGETERSNSLPHINPDKTLQELKPKFTEHK